MAALRPRRTALGACAALSLMLAAAAQARAGGWLGRLTAPRDAAPAAAGEPPLTVRQLGKLIDDLDGELFARGMIAIKAPDVWGQNRMTKFRAEYENEMVKTLSQFQYKLNGAMRTSDVAVLTSSTAFSAARGATAAPARLPRGAGVPVANVSAAQGATAAPTLPTPGAEAGPLLEDIAKRLDNLQASVLQLPADAAGGVQLEPNIQLDEHSSYIQHLQELRRINVGDDIADLPGYGLYLVRMPVSLLPGPKVRRGKGAAVTVEAGHRLTPDLLANTFRDVVIMDATYGLAAVLEKVLHGAVRPADLPPGPPLTRLDRRAGVTRTAYRHDPPAPPPVDRNSPGPEAEAVPPADGPGLSPPTTVEPLDRSSAPAPQSFLGAGVRGASGAGGGVAASEAMDLYGADLAVLADAVSADAADWYVHDPSVISWLIGELNSAHRFMREEARNGALGPLFSGEEFRRIDALIQRRNYQGLTAYRREFLARLVLARNGYDPAAPTPGRAALVKRLTRVTDVLVFALMVHSVLVDRQLKHDMDVTAERRGCACADLEALCFYDLFPTPEAKEAFNRYVACKWPVHVFALDPAVDQQNALSVYSLRSEIQMALAVAVASGQFNVDNATKFARRLDSDLTTVALNRTAVGFGAGETTFGWRFYPRLQAPPPQNNFARAAGLLVNGGPRRDYTERNREIETGPRECVALMVVPNFVPAVGLTTTANWFDAAGHHAAETLDSGDYLALSRKLQHARNALAGVCDPGEYRPGEVGRMARRLDQLEALLPTQDYRVGLPDEGDLAGSEIFSSNAAQLAPRLLTWYGEPAKVGADSRVFLVGSGFAVLETEVIAGGVPALRPSLLSRNVLSITIPDSARPIRTNDGRTVFDVHVATPNGVSNHLHVAADPGVVDRGPRVHATEVTTTTATAPNLTTTKTRLETTAPGIILPPGTILPMGTAIPPGLQFGPYAAPGGAGTVPQPAPPAAPTATTTTTTPAATTTTPTTARVVPSAPRRGPSPTSRNPPGQAVPAPGPAALPDGNAGPEAALRRDAPEPRSPEDLRRLLFGSAGPGGSARPSAASPPADPRLARASATTVAGAGVGPATPAAPAKPPRRSLLSRATTWVQDAPRRRAARLDAWFGAVGAGTAAR